MELPSIHKYFDFSLLRLAGEDVYLLEEVKSQCIFFQKGMAQKSVNLYASAGPVGLTSSLRKMKIIFFYEIATLRSQ